MTKHHLLRAVYGLGVSILLASSGAAMAASPNASAQGQAHSQEVSNHSAGNAGTSGTSTQPQPLSNADQNTGGANGQCPGGPYCSTRDGSPSGNGNQVQGQHYGEPCAGCVGKADNKNPKGQMPDGSDNNNGYECDGNHGIGQSDPAHTGCTGAVTPPNCEQSNSCPPANCQDEHNCPPPTCTHDCTPGSGCVTNCTPGRGGVPSVLGEATVFQPAVLAASVAPGRGALPQTGSGEEELLLAFAGSLLAAGFSRLIQRRI